MNGVAITYPSGKYNPAGVSRVAYAFVEDILTFPALGDPLTATDYAELVKFENPIVMKTGKQFFDLYCTLEEGEVKSTVVGPRDGKGFENSIGISFPGNDENFLGFQAASANRPIVFAVLEKNKVVRIVGSIDDPAFLDTAEGTSGKKASDGRATVLTFKASGATPAPIYHLEFATLLVPAA